MREISAQLTLHAARIAQTVCDQMYENPFWMARFGERGRRFAQEDGRFHLQYLVQALEGRDAGPLTSYARWVQGVLTNRGMCTRHLEENFQRLSRTLRAEGYPEVAEAQDYLEQAVRALRYSHPLVGELQEKMAPLAVSAVRALLDAHPDWAPKPTSRARCEDDARYHLSYVADAIANGRSEQFAAHVRWALGFLQRYGVPPAHSVALLDALASATAGALSPATADEAAAILRLGAAAARDGAA